MEHGGESENLQKDLLKCLMQYGDSLLDEEEYQTMKKKKKKAARPVHHVSDVQQNNSQYSDKDSLELSTHGKKNKKKKRTSEKLVKQPALSKKEKVSIDNVSMKSKHKQLLKFKAELGLSLLQSGKVSTAAVVTAPNNSAVDQQQSPQAPTLASKNSSLANVVIFDDPAKRKKKRTAKLQKVITEQPTETLAGSSPSISTAADEEQPVFDLKRARFEVHKLGIQAFEGQDKEAAQAALAIRLGAKPAKRKYVNYMELQNERKKMKEDAKDKREKDRSMGYKVGKTKSKDSGRKKEIRKMGDLDSQLGSYKGGVQKLSQHDIDNVKKNIKHVKGGRRR